MAAAYFYGVTGKLTQPIDAYTTAIEVDAALAGTLSVMGPGDFTFLSISAGSYYELVKVTGYSGTVLIVQRGVNTTPLPFPAGAKLAFEVTAEAIESDIIQPPNIAVITGSGQANVSTSSPNVFNVDVPTPVVSSGQGVEITGTWPNITINIPPKDCCGGDSEDGAGVGITSLQGLGIIQAYATGAEGFVNLPAPVFTGVGMTITGTWPNYTFTAASAAGGTVLSVAAGPGLAITGSPTVNPTVNMSNSGVVAGTYGGIAINARGQITAVPVTLNPVSIINVALPLTVGRVTDAVSLNINSATAGVRGVVPLTDHTDPFDPLDTTSAMTPAAVQVALDTVIRPDVTGASSYTSEADALYVNTVGGSATAFQLAAGEKAIIIATATVTANADPLIPHTWGLAVFNATPLKLKANKSIKQIHQSLIFTMTGPATVTSLAIVTTDLTGATLLSYDLEILKL